jgi:hypothetical protein
MSEIGTLLFIGQDIGHAAASASGYLPRAVIWDRAARRAARRHPPAAAILMPGAGLALGEARGIASAISPAPLFMLVPIATPCTIAEARSLGVVRVVEFGEMAIEEILAEIDRRGDRTPAAPAGAPAQQFAHSPHRSLSGILGQAREALRLRWPDVLPTILGPWRGGIVGHWVGSDHRQR